MITEHCLFTDPLNQKTVNKTICRTPSANPCQLWAHLLESFPVLAIVFFSLSGFPDLSGKVFSITFKSSKLITQQCSERAM